ncbi:MAG: sodium:solute symporter family protein, partial [Planctomycetes bacterium]|nr:sodium:solute symporter family protein [Planctomycetota bacterium]
MVVLAQATERIGSNFDLVVIAVYLLAVLGFGAMFGRHTRSTRDFFMSGQRFSGWLITMSYIATLVGSYSFMKYSQAGYQYGISSTSTYVNDWFIMPLFMFGWLPIIYFNRVVSVPEYFERRFDSTTRILGTAIILLYMIGYIGYNLFTIGKALEPVLGMSVMQIVLITAVFCGIYVTAGGQTSVIMTDLAQGILLLVAGVGVFLLGIWQLGGWSVFWDALPQSHKYGMADFNTPSDFNAVGLFWQDGIANSFVFYFMNQGILLRFLSAKSPAEGRKAAIYIALIMMPITAVAVSGAGWIGKAMLTLGLLPADTDPNQIFVTVSDIVCSKGMFGVVLAALTAALMSTIDTLINAVSAIAVNDIYRPYIKRGAADRHYLTVARVVSVAVAAIGVILVPFFMTFRSLYGAHAAFTAAITPPVVVVILLGCLWPRYGARAAKVTIILGSLAIFASIAWPDWLIGPISHGMRGERGFKFMRALYGILACGGVAVLAGWIFGRG